MNPYVHPKIGQVMNSGVMHGGSQSVHPRRQFMSAEDRVREASEQFYAALNRMVIGDAASMADVWSHGTTVTAMHPIGGRQVGWDLVRESFEQVAGLASGGEIALRDQMIQVAGDVAYELGVERGQAELAGQEIRVDSRVTNIYRREQDGWKMVHHHSDLSAEMVDLLNRLQAER
jgi:ketosteroid isomerase-like protein